ncbi:HEPN domain protein [Mahella australiensis 50-1 BON]|uniref:HEPN domain protein n=1 Tax=Mahella australiensis (strain DSM 15567 / CIP 107919 / 50-1 BON) TaxID=697281 RepID=F3ZWW6_MAHA5|nr:HEPN domain protein [Mahella australiensis 50-1 BON]
MKERIIDVIFHAAKQEAESQMRQAEKFVEGVRQFIRQQHQVE